MKIGYYGDGAWARECFRLVRESEELELVFVVGRYGTPDPELRTLTEEAGLPFRAVEDVNSEEFLEWVRDFKVDVQASMSYDQIIGQEIRDLAPSGFVNCHAGALPFYRGRNVLNWALINGEDRFGITVHEMDSGIDTGDILLQKYVPIHPDDDYGDLLNKAVEECAVTLHQALRQVAKGTVDRSPQDQIHPVGFYCSKRREGDEWIDWGWSAKRVHNFVRALAPPGPGARTLLGGNMMAITETELIPQAPTYIDRPGSVVGTGPNSCIVKTGDSTLRIQRVASVGQNGALRDKRPPGEFRLGRRLRGRKERQVEQLQKRVEALERRLDED